jgi:elongation factor Ts
MAAFTAQDVKALREKTGCGMMDCKKALTNADGDMDKAVDFLREQGLAKQAKKASRVAAEGVAYACTNDDLSVGVVVEVNAETDFVAKNDSFMDFVKACANTIIEQNPADVEALLALKASGSDQTIAEMLQEKVLTIGENIQIRRFERMEGACVAYVHAGGKIGVLVNFDTDLAAKPEFVAYGKDVAMQIAALNTPYLNESEVPAEIIEHEKEVMRQQVILRRLLTKSLWVRLASSTRRTASSIRNSLRTTRLTLSSTHRTLLTSLAVLSKSRSSFVLKRAKALKSVRTTLLQKLQVWLNNCFDIQSIIIRAEIKFSALFVCLKLNLIIKIRNSNLLRNNHLKNIQLSTLSPSTIKALSAISASGESL